MTNLRNISRQIQVRSTTPKPMARGYLFSYLCPIHGFLSLETMAYKYYSSLEVFLVAGSNYEHHRHRRTFQSFSEALE